LNEKRRRLETLTIPKLRFQAQNCGKKCRAKAKRQQHRNNNDNNNSRATTMTAVTITKSTTAQKKNKHASKQTKQTKNYRTKYVT